jgi:hypothetical protein
MIHERLGRVPRIVNAVCARDPAAYAGMIRGFGSSWL